MLKAQEIQIVTGAGGDGKTLMGLNPLQAYGQGVGPDLDDQSHAPTTHAGVTEKHSNGSSTKKKPKPKEKNSMKNKNRQFSPKL